MELPVWAYSNIGGITGHIDLLAFYYKDNNLYILILDFKPNRLSEILKSIPQLTIYGQLFGHHIVYWIKKLNLTTTFNYNFKIKCGGFNNNELYLFDPFEIYSNLFTFMTEQLSFAKISFLDLKTFFASKINI